MDLVGRETAGAAPVALHALRQRLGLVVAARQRPIRTQRLLAAAACDQLKLGLALVEIRSRVYFLARGGGRGVWLWLWSARKLPVPNGRIVLRFVLDSYLGRFQPDWDDRLFKRLARSVGFQNTLSHFSRPNRIANRYCRWTLEVASSHDGVARGAGGVRDVATVRRDRSLHKDLWLYRKDTNVAGSDTRAAARSPRPARKRRTCLTLRP